MGRVIGVLLGGICAIGIVQPVAASGRCTTERDFKAIVSHQPDRSDVDRLTLAVAAMDRHGVKPCPDWADEFADIANEKRDTEQYAVARSEGPNPDNPGQNQSEEGAQLAELETQKQELATKTLEDKAGRGSSNVSEDTEQMRKLKQQIAELVHKLNARFRQDLSDID